MKKILFLTLLLLPTIAFAEEDGGAMSITIKVFANMLPSLVGMFWAFASWFIDPSWYTWGVFWLSSVFKNIWVLVSNVVYMIFWWMIIWIAFMNIISAEGDNYALKTALPKLIVWILMVPFTWYIVQFVLSVSAVMTTSVLLLPKDMIVTSAKDERIKIKDICVYDFTQKSPWSQWESWDTSSLKRNECYSSWTWEKSITDIFDTWAYWILYYYTYEIFKVNQLDSIDFDGLVDAFSINNPGGFVKELSNQSVVSKGAWGLIQIVFNLIIAIAYFLLLAALVVALITRIIRLWIYTMASPIFALSFYLWKASDKIFDIKEFIKLAFVPFLVAWALAFWVLFLSVITVWINKLENEGDFCTPSNGKYFEIWQPRENNPLLYAWKTTSPTDYVICINWKPTMVFKGVVNTTNNENTDWKSLEVSWLGHIILKIFWIVVIWMSVMAAFKYSEITEKAVEPIWKIWSNIWSLAKDIPSHIPVTPGGLSISSFQQMSWAPKAAMQARSSNAISNNDLLKKVKSNATWNWFDYAKKNKLMARYAKNSQFTGSQIDREAKDLVWLLNTSKWWGNSDFLPVLDKFLDKLNNATVTNDYYESYWVKNNKWSLERKDALRVLAGWSYPLYRTILDSENSKVTLPTNISVWNNKYSDSVDNSRYGKAFIDEDAAADKTLIRVVNDRWESVTINLTTNMDVSSLSSWDKTFNNIFRNMDSNVRSSIVEWMKVSVNVDQKLELLRSIYESRAWTSINDRALKAELNTIATRLGISQRELDEMINKL